MTKMFLSLRDLENRINYRFRDDNLLKIAITHRSSSMMSYERLEFLGDSVLGLIISEELYKIFPDLKEGKLSRIRANLVCGENLGQICQKLGLVDFLITNQSHQNHIQNIPLSLQADLVESIIGAIYLDSDLNICRTVILPWYAEKFATLNPDDVFKDSKTQLQEWLQARNHPLPKYELLQIEGEEHHKIFNVSCYIDVTRKTLCAKGSSRRKAEQAVAETMLKYITDNKLT